MPINYFFVSKNVFDGLGICTNIIQVRKGFVYICVAIAGSSFSRSDISNAIDEPISLFYFCEKRKPK